MVSVEFAVKHGYLMSDEEIKSGTTSQAVDGVIDLVKDARKILAPMQDAMDAPSTVELSQWHGTMLQLLGNTNDLLRFIAAHYTAKDDKRFILKAQAELKSVLAAVKAKTAKADALAALVSIYATLGFVTQRYFIESAD